MNDNCFFFEELMNVAQKCKVHEKRDQLLQC